MLTYRQASFGMLHSSMSIHVFLGVQNFYCSCYRGLGSNHVKHVLLITIYEIPCAHCAFSDHLHISPLHRKIPSTPTIPRTLAESSFHLSQLHERDMRQVTKEHVSACMFEVWMDGWMDGCQYVHCLMYVWVDVNMCIVDACMYGWMYVNTYVHCLMYVCLYEWMDVKKTPFLTIQNSRPKWCLAPPVWLFPPPIT